MKKYFVLFFISLKIFGLENYHCKWNSYEIKFSKIDKEPISFEIFSKKNKLMACTMDVFYEKGNLQSESDFDLIRLEKKSCSIVYDKQAKSIVFVDNGYLKFKAKDKYMSAYIIKNENPILCEKVK